MEDPQSSSEWLDRENAAEKSNRLARLDWMAALHAETTDYLVQGGLESIQLFNEARYCYVYGQYLAVTILGVAFVERMIAARFYAADRNDLEQARGVDLLRAALHEGWITDAEFRQFDCMRKLRNPLVHFRRPLADGRIVMRAINEERDVFELLKSDAEEVLKNAFIVMRRFAQWRK